MSFTPSPQQADFFFWVQREQGSCVLEAVAGAGKTTTLVHALSLMAGDVFFGAYNKAIAEEIKGRVAVNPNARIDVSTFHAAGFRFWRRVAPKVRVDGGKMRTLFREASAEKPEMKPFEASVLKLVSLGKQAGLGAIRRATEEAWSGLVDHHDVEAPELPEAHPWKDARAAMIRLAHKALQRSLELDTEVIDFDDMIYAPLAHDAKIWQHDWVLIDEAQDTNATRRELALRMLKPGTGRLVAVGDPHQAIYGFTGADSDALDLISSATGARRLPLTVTYRCPKTVVAFAHQWVKHIEAHESAPDGIVRQAELKNLPAEARPGDAVLCRKTSPLLTHAYALIAKGVPVHVEGREIGDGLKALARRWKAPNLSILSDYLNTYVENETTKLRAKERESKAVALEDKVECLRVLINRVREVVGKNANQDDLCAEIDRLFSDDGHAATVTFSTIHKSKGREWGRVVWLETGISPWARQQWEIQQEHNLCYVAATRAKSELVRIALPR